MIFWMFSIAAVIMLTLLVIADIELVGGNAGFITELLGCVVIAAVIRDDVEPVILQLLTNCASDAARAPRYHRYTVHIRLSAIHVVGPR